MASRTMFRYVACLSALCALSQPLHAAVVTGKVEVRTAPGVTPAPTVVYAEPVAKAAPMRPLTVRLSQKDKMFTPAILAVPVGSTVEFPNDDPIFHNVFSLSAPAPFDLGLYRAGASKARQFTQPGSYRVFCNIHPQMMAHITVVPTPFVTIAGPDGRFTFDLPAGVYRITARSDRAAAVTVTITVGSGAGTVPELNLDESQYVAIPHKNKFGRDYPASAYEKKGGG